MIVVDTSALMAIILDEPQAEACMAVIEAEEEVLISAGTVAEALIVAGRRNVLDEVTRLIEGLGFEVVAVTPAAARRIAGAYAKWGKGINPAALNFGDCFAYDVAKEYGRPLLYVGDDFSKTDIESALSEKGQSVPPQLSFPGLEAPRPSPPTDRLFFAIFPDVAAADRIARAAVRLRGESGLKGRPLATDRFHVTLHHVGDYSGLSQDVVSAICEAAETVRMPPFEVVFDRAMSFSGKPGNRPLVLRGGEGLAALGAFQQALAMAIRKTGQGRTPPAQFTPHVTLLYDDLLIQERPVDPINWTVGEFVLVHSLLGRTQHVPLARWTLNA